MGHRVIRRLAAGAGQVAERAVELRHGVHTAEHVSLADLGLETGERVSHDASSWVALHRALARLDIGRDDVFADIGSGLGRALLVAGRFPFRRLVGVEVSPELNERARGNLERSRARRRTGHVELVTADALDWEIPLDLTVAYMYCPFVGSVFERFLERLLESVDRRPRTLRLVYNYPLEHLALLRTGRARVLDVAAGTWPAPTAPPDRIVTYLVLPSDRALAQQLAGRFPVRARERAWVDARVTAA